MAALPDWLDRSLLTAQVFHAPLALPAGSGAALRTAARAIVATLGPPADPDARTALLNGLRLATHVKVESRAEAVARFRLLRRACADLSADVLAEACDRYARAERFFPTAIADLLGYARAIIADRRRTAHRLERLAALADDADAERRRLAEDPATPEAIAAIRAEFGLGRRG